MEVLPSEFTRRITLTSYDYVQGDAGGVSAVAAESFDTWAKWEQKGGGMGANQEQMQGDENVRVTVRYRPQVTVNWFIVYEGQVYRINKMSFDNPGYKRFIIIECSVSIKLQSWS